MIHENGAIAEKVGDVTCSHSRGGRTRAGGVLRLEGETRLRACHAEDSFRRGWWGVRGVQAWRGRSTALSSVSLTRRAERVRRERERERDVSKKERIRKVREREREKNKRFISTRGIATRGLFLCPVAVLGELPVAKTGSANAVSSDGRAVHGNVQLSARCDRYARQPIADQFGKIVASATVR